MTTTTTRRTISPSVRRQIIALLDRYMPSTAPATIRHAVLRALSPRLADDAERIVRYALRRHRARLQRVQEG